MQSSKMKTFVLLFITSLFCFCTLGCYKQKTILPTVTTSDITYITATTADGGGTVINNGIETILTRGVCWGINHNPTISDSTNYEATHIGFFYSGLKYLQPSTKYYVRAFASNSAGIAYGDEKSFVTLAH